MRSKPQSPIWPYLGILACLFVLSVTAPRAWDRLARKEPVGQSLAARPDPQAPARQWPEPARPAIEVDFSAPPPPISPEEAAHDSELDDGTDHVEPPPTLHTAPLEWPQIVPPAPEFALEVEAPVTIVEIAPLDRRGVEQILELVGEPEPPPRPASTPPAAESGWPLPRVLLDQLAAVIESDPSALWARQASQLIGELCRPFDEQGRAPRPILQELRQLADDDSAIPNKQLGQTIRARYALSRWLDVWEPAASLDETLTAGDSEWTSTDGVKRSLPAVEQRLDRGAAGAAWRKYLRLDAISKAANDPQTTEHQRRAVARKVLDRIDSPVLTTAQRRLLSDPAVVTLAKELRAWAVQSVGSNQLLAHINAYEKSALPSAAALVADDWRGLRWQTAENAAAVAEKLETHYRNANLRLALSAELLNRWLPQPDAVHGPVRDRIMDVPVYGWNTTFTNVSVRLIPDPRHLRIGLEADGLVASKTVSDAGPARFRNRGQSTFLVQKLLVLDPRGLAVWPAVAEANSNFNYLESVETGFDRVPLVGSLVQNIARSQHDEMRGQARVEVEQKVAHRARQQFDAEIEPRLVKAAQAVQDQQVATLQRLGLELAPIGLSTTEERIVARVRLASPRQLGAHTPRPRAPSDSWASLQVHQSAINNGIESLDLNGRTFTIEELFAWVAKKLDRPEIANQEDLPEDVSMTFAERDAIRVCCEDGRAEVMFSFAELKQGRNRWRNFTVRSYYMPRQQGNMPRFVRDKGTIFLEGKSLKGRPQITLRAIFSRVLSLNRDLNLIDESIANDPRLKDLAISQFVVEHGWIGVAYSPARPAARVVRKPE